MQGQGNRIEGTSFHFTVAPSCSFNCSPSSWYELICLHFVIGQLLQKISYRFFGIFWFWDHTSSCYSAYELTSFMSWLLIEFRRNFASSRFIASTYSSFGATFRSPHWIKGCALSTSPSISASYPIACNSVFPLFFNFGKAPHLSVILEEKERVLPHIGKIVQHMDVLGPHLGFDQGFCHHWRLEGVLIEYRGDVLPKIGEILDDIDTIGPHIGVFAEGSLFSTSFLIDRGSTCHARAQYVDGPQEICAPSSRCPRWRKADYPSNSGETKPASWGDWTVSWRGN